MKSNVAKLGSLVLLGAIALLISGCAETGAGWPAYRGQYYAYDVYPYGYNGYPGFPYYGAPFGRGGPAFAATQQTTTVEQKTTTTTRHRAHRRHRVARNVNSDR